MDDRLCFECWKHDSQQGEPYYRYRYIYYIYTKRLTPPVDQEVIDSADDPQFYSGRCLMYRAGLSSLGSSNDGAFQFQAWRVMSALARAHVFVCVCVSFKAVSELFNHRQ